MVPLRSVRFPPQGTGREAAYIWVGPRGADPAQGFRPRQTRPCWLRSTCTASRPPPWVVPHNPSSGTWTLAPATPHPPTPISGSHCPFIPTQGTRVDLEGATRSLKLPWQAEPGVSQYLLATPLPQALVVQDSPTTASAETFHRAKAPGTGGTQFLGALQGIARVASKRTHGPHREVTAQPPAVAGSGTEPDLRGAWFGAPL